MAAITNSAAAPQIAAIRASPFDPLNADHSVEIYLRDEKVDLKELCAFLKNYFRVNCKGNVALFTGTFYSSFDMALIKGYTDVIKIFMDIGLDYNWQRAPRRPVFQRLLKRSFEGIDELIDLALQKGAVVFERATEKYVETLFLRPSTNLTLNLFQKIMGQEIRQDGNKFRSDILDSINGVKNAAVANQLVEILLKPFLPHFNFQQEPNPSFLLDQVGDPLALLEHNREIPLNAEPPRALWIKYGPDEASAFDNLLKLIEQDAINILIDPNIKNDVMTHLTKLITRPLGRSLVLSLVESQVPIIIQYDKDETSIIQAKPGHKHIRLQWAPHVKLEGVVLEGKLKVAHTFENHFSLAHEFFHILLWIKSPPISDQLTQTPPFNPDCTNANEEFTIACENLLRKQFGLPERYGHLTFDAYVDQHRLKFMEEGINQV